MKRCRLVLFLVALASVCRAGAAGSFAPSLPAAPQAIEPDGTLDQTFNAGQFTNGQVWASALQPDGKLLIGGQFAKVHGQTRLGVARLNADGTLDATFVPPAGVGLDARQIVVQLDGKILVVASEFATLNLTRLNQDGSLDNSFGFAMDGFYDPASGSQIAAPYVRGVLLQLDGKIIVFGSFSKVKNASGTLVERTCIARLNSDGSLDESYNPGSGFYFDGYTPAVSHAVQQRIGPNAGKIVAQGDFTYYNNTPAPGLVRLNVDASFDTSFNFGGGAQFELSGVSRQTDDRVLVFGTFTSFSGAPHNGIVRLDATTGAVDAGFNPPAFQDYAGIGTILTIAEQSSGKLVVGGSFHSVGGVAANNVVRLETNGSQDATFSGVAAGVNASNVGTVLVRPGDDKIFVGGYFSTYGGAYRNNFAWVNGDGSVDSAFAGLSGATDFDPEVYALAVQPDGKILVGGLFSSFNGASHYNLVRLNPDSTVDSSFNPNFGTKGSVRAILLQPDGKIVIAGNPEAVGGVARGRIARLNADGTLDTGFDPGSGADSTVMALSQDSAGNIYAGGDFEQFNGASHRHLVKLDSAGAVVSNFNPNGGFNGTIYTITPEDASGRIVVGGQFTVSGVPTHRGIARIDLSSGAIDTTFNSGGTGFGGTVFSLKVAPDGSYFATGLITTYNNVSRNRVAKLTSSGALDTTFTSPFSNQYSPTFRALALENGKVILAGSGSPTVPALVRLTATGSVDSSFNIGTGFAVSPPSAYWINFPELRAVIPQVDGKLLAGGLFNNYNGAPRIALVRLTGDEAGTTPAGRVGNVSTRLPVGAGDDALIEGFIVQGSPGSTKRILVRALGPWLTQFGINDALANPTLEIHDSSGATIATNNDWKNTQIGGLITGDQAAEISSSRLAPAEDLESAVVIDLPPGDYTAVVRGVNNTTGTGIVDAYDLSGSSPARLANVATRGLVQAGDKLMIAGFIVQNAPVKLVVRAIGPSLLAVGINNALPDTTLQLRDENGAVVLENDDWKTNQQQELEATGLQPSHDLEAALVTTIPPGQYTAQVRGKNDASGIGVVEVYFLQ